MPAPDIELFLSLIMPQFSIRPATPDDALAIATVQYHGWQQTYRGIIADSYLDNMTLEKGHKNWQYNLQNPKGTINVMEDPQGRVIAFSGAGRCRTKEFDCDAELYALYLLKEYQGQGLGRKMFMYEVQNLIKSGYKSFFVYVLAANPSVGFYRSFKPDNERLLLTKIADNEYDELCLGWSNMQSC